MEPVIKSRKTASEEEEDTLRYGDIISIKQIVDDHRIAYVSAKG